jgi:hypothetical protein
MTNYIDINTMEESIRIIKETLLVCGSIRMKMRMKKNNI